MHCISQNGQLKACMCKLLKICTCVQLCSEYNILKNCLFWKWQWIKHSWLYWVWHSHLIGMSQKKGCLNTVNRIHCTYVIVNFVVRFRLDFPQRYFKPATWTPFSCYSSCCWNFLIKLLFFNTKQVTTKLKNRYTIQMTFLVIFLDLELENMRKQQHLGTYHDPVGHIKVPTTYCGRTLARLFTVKRKKF